MGWKLKLLLKRDQELAAWGGHLQHAYLRKRMTTVFSVLSWSWGFLAQRISCLQRCSVHMHKADELRALSAPESFVLCEHEGLLRSCEPGECVGRYSGRQPVRSEMSSLLAEDVNGSAAAGGARWGALCQECAGSAETL